MQLFSSLLFQDCKHAKKFQTWMITCIHNLLSWNWNLKMCDKNFGDTQNSFRKIEDDQTERKTLDQAKKMLSIFTIVDHTFETVKQSEGSGKSIKRIHFLCRLKDNPNELRYLRAGEIQAFTWFLRGYLHSLKRSNDPRFNELIKGKECSRVFYRKIFQPKCLKKFR